MTTIMNAREESAPGIIHTINAISHPATIPRTNKVVHPAATAAVAISANALLTSGLKILKLASAHANASRARQICDEHNGPETQHLHQRRQIAERQKRQHYSQSILRVKLLAPRITARKPTL